MTKFKPKTQLLFFIGIIFFHSISSTCYAIVQQEKINVAQLNKKAKFKIGKNQRKKRKQIRYSGTIKTIAKNMRKKIIDNENAWQLASNLERSFSKMRPKEKSGLLTLQSKILRNEQYYILSAIYSAKAINVAKQKGSRELNFAWKNLAEISRIKPIKTFLSILAGNVGMKDNLPHGWNEDWNYIVALNLASKGKMIESIREFEKLTPDNRNFFPASFRKAMLYNEYSKNQDAIRELKNFLLEGFLDRSPLRELEKKNLRNLAALSLGRIYYEEEDFQRSIFFYRQVEKDSLHYYDALFEQAWPLFMFGKPNHALGALYSLHTPFFDNRYNPESSILKSIIYFWICHYDQSRNSLATFLDKHQRTSKVINTFAKKGALTPATAFKVFLARINGQKIKEIPDDVLAYVVDQPSLYSHRNQLAAVLEEKQKLLKNGLFGKQANTQMLKKKLNIWIKALKKEIGLQVINELQVLSLKFEEHMRQAKFLYIELIMGESKKQVGKNLYEEEEKTKDLRQQVFDFLIGWSNKDNMSWASSDKNEVWWDEIGFHVANEESKCIN